MIKCVIFDCDGTLVDSEYLCNLGLEIKLEGYGLSASARDMMQRFRGAALADIVESLEAEHQINFDADFIPDYRAIVDKLFEEHLQPCDSVGEMLAILPVAKCVASSGPPEKIRKALSLTGLSEYFSGNLFSSYEIGSWKPEPDIFLHAAKVMGFEPAHCAVVEDSLVGLSAAKSAGMLPILYDPDGLHKSVNDVAKIRHMNELISVVTKERYEHFI